MNFLNTTVHLQEDDLELYALRRLEESKLPAFEEHLLICHHCQDRLGETDQYIHDMRAAARQLAAQPKAETSWLTRLAAPLFAIPKPALAMGMAAALALVLVIRIPTGSTATEILDLTATRASAAPKISSKVRPELRLSVEGLPASQAFTAEVVTSSGSEIWTGKAGVEAGKAVVKLASPLAPGQYWVRLYKDGARNELLREYSLNSN